MWIDARDELPEYGRWVLCWLGDNWYAVGIHNGEWWTDGEYNDIPVKCWQPLPSAPSERKPKPQTARTCGDCKNWQDGSCNLPRSPRFTDKTDATDGCTPNKKARANWI